MKIFSVDNLQLWHQSHVHWFRSHHSMVSVWVGLGLIGKFYLILLSLTRKCDFISINIALCIFYVYIRQQSAGSPANFEYFPRLHLICLYESHRSIWNYNDIFLLSWLFTHDRWHCDSHSQDYKAFWKHKHDNRRQALPVIK